MAFFRATNGTQYFTCFYAQDDHRFSGMFYVLTDRSARYLSSIYKYTAIFCLLAFLLHLALPLIIGATNTEQQEILFASFLIMDALAILPAALMILNRKKVSIKDELLHVCKKGSVYVYLTVALVPLNYTIVMIWLAIYVFFTPYMLFMIALTFATTMFSVYRIRQVLS